MDKPFDLYELYYANHKTGEPLVNTEAQEITGKPADDCIADLLRDINDKHIEPKCMKEINFSDVAYNLMPITNGKEIRYVYIPMFKNGKKEISISEHLTRFKKFNIDDLPLIGVAKFLGISVEKSNTIEPFGKYNAVEDKITIGTDYVLTFIHELVHAVDIRQPDFYYIPNLIEPIAECTAVLLCKKYNISFDLSYSLYYLDEYGIDEILNNVYSYRALLQRVSRNYEFINECVEKIKEADKGSRKD